jgi:hypothetical protein
MQFTLQSLMILFVVVASAITAFGPGGLFAAGFVLIVSAYIRNAKSMLNATFITLSIITFVLFALLFYSALYSARESERRSQCINNVYQLSLALHQYESEHGHLPPAYIVGPDGKLWHSWRVLILPYLGRKDLFDAYNFDEPWDGPNNSKLAQKMPKIYQCPSDPNSYRNAIANYFAITGDKTVWPNDKSVKLSDITDGKDKTILLVEMPNSGINWLEPRDIKLEDVQNLLSSQSPIKFFSSHPYKHGYFYKSQTGACTAFVDGHAQFLTKEFFTDYVTELCSRTRNDPVPFDENYKLDWSKISALIIFVLSSALLIFRPRERNKPTAAQEE